MLLKILKSVWLRLPSWRALFYRPKKDTYLFLPINGAGLGHLTRSLAIAKKLRIARPDAEIIFLTTSIGVPLVHRAGFTCHHVTPSSLLNVGAIVWNRLFYQTLRSILSVHRPSILVFDGTVPYLALQKLMFSHKNIRYIWVKRGLYKEGVNRELLNSYVKRFDKVIAPGELIDSPLSKTLDDKNVFPVNPISLIDRDEILSRLEAREALRLDKRPCAYVQLGAGNINGISDLQERLVGSLQRLGVQVVLGLSPISLSRQFSHGADKTIVDYPNSKYFSAFDFAVVAAGYNSVCEVVMLGLPAVFFPNIETGADDQAKRAMHACAFGRYECMLDFDDEKFSSVVGRLLDGEGGGERYARENGAIQAAKIIALAAS